MTARLGTIAPAFLRWRRRLIVAGAFLVGFALLARGQGDGLDHALHVLRDEIRPHDAGGARAIGGFGPLVLALLIVVAAVRAKAPRLRLFLFGAGSVALMALPLAGESLLGVTIAVGPALAALASAILLAGAGLAFERYLDKALTDDSTGLPNLGALEAAAARRPVASIVVARIDRFAALAAALGPEAAAKLVQRVAERLRFAEGGREIYHVEAAHFAWIEDKGDKDGLEHRFDGLAALMRAPVECVLAFGIATDARASPRQLVANAGLAASQAAQAGARWRRFALADDAAVDWRIALLGELDGAMANGQIWNSYQPKLDLATGLVTGVETLVRWAHPIRGPIGPDSFIPVIEEAGRIRDLTAFVLHQALDDALAWDRAGFPLGVAVNVSATLLADHEFIEGIGRILGGHGLPSARVTIEVTESAAMASPARAIAALQSWRALGLTISIDDYGTGQSSLKYLQKLPATELKIDKSFVRSIVTDSRNAIMVRSTVELAHQLGMTTVAEGIEDEACQALLAEIGCDSGQGYHIGRPMSASELAAFLAERPRAAA